MEYYSVLKSHEILTHATMWINLEDMLSEINHLKKNKINYIYVSCAYQGLTEGGMRNQCLIGKKFQLCKIKSVADG
jgi:hypothetical protein